MMNTLLERLKALNPTDGKPCRMRQLIDSLESETAALLTTLLANPHISAREIHRTLQEGGYRIARENVSEHRNGKCRCSSTGEIK